MKLSPREMKVLLAAGVSIVVFFLIIQSSSGSYVESEMGVVPNKTDAFGVVIDANTSSIEQHGAAIVGNEAEEKRRSLAIFFILFVLVLAILIVHILIISKIHFIPESLAIVILGAAVGSILSYSEHDYSEIEALSPDIFFLVLLPPIIFENAYNLNKGYFFSNIGPILSFAIVGTAISALVIGFCIYILGQADLVFELSVFECFAFASMISAVDPVATLAIFQAVKVEGLLYMLVFGESMLNDAVSIVFAATAIRHSHPPLNRKTPSLEFALLLVFAYIPYGFAEAMSLSGIMAILFCGITMSQYTQQNISPVTQITFRQTFRTISFVAETSTFAYIGMAFFTIKLNFQPSLIFWCIVLCLVSRALNIFPISYAVNKCRREVQISTKNQIILWFSGMRGAVCFALVLYMEVEKEKKSVILTTTLFLILFTILFLGGTVMPFISFINRCYPDERPRRRRRSLRKQKDAVMMSKTQEMVYRRFQLGIFSFRTSIVLKAMFGSDEWTPRKSDQSDRSSTAAGRIMRQLFVRKFTASEKQENREKLAALTRRVLRNDDSDSEVDECAPHAPLIGSA
ncbi:sodium/hydrogen exchanger 3 [Necator americanus]|uniref:Sodium/hydrogen exchanger 8 n=1 Tax=Necator americanus TaxID=51031 RepID=W2TTX5_NECAM|nr:sodium/hydrogen exchanger 3 [Necator americanus]ETN85530.1 sodium/hydrogen exchanger 3 [Necator americanus]